MFLDLRSISVYSTENRDNVYLGFHPFIECTLQQHNGALYFVEDVLNRWDLKYTYSDASAIPNILSTWFHTLFACMPLCTQISTCLILNKKPMKIMGCLGNQFCIQYLWPRDCEIIVCANSNNVVLNVFYLKLYFCLDVKELFFHTKTY